MKKPNVPDASKPHRAGSFCIPRAAVEALLDNHATAYEVCAYLILARFTDESGQYSTASISAVNRYTGANKTKNGPVGKALERLKTIHAKSTSSQPAEECREPNNGFRDPADLGPIVFERSQWLQATGEVINDGPHPRARVNHVLPDFNELAEDRIWISNNLIDGYGDFKQPLKLLKNAGDAAARLLLLFYTLNDMQAWGGVPPIGPGVFADYESVGADMSLKGGARLVRRKYARLLAFIDARITATKGEQSYFDALTALRSTGFVYEVVTVVNREPIVKTNAKGENYSLIPEDAEPLYELDVRSQHGFKPKGEEGIGGATARTAGELGAPVTLNQGEFDGTYAAIVPDGHECMIAGIFRLRFRVSNPKNAYVKSTWASIHQRNREALDFVNIVRARNGLTRIERFTSDG